MKVASVSKSRIREEALKDPRYPVHLIADQLRPYLQVLIEQFHPEQVILFGSYANGDPTPDSDIDLLVVKPVDRSSISDATSIRRAIRPLRHTVANLPLDIMVRSPHDWQERLNKGGFFHTSIDEKGIRLI